jgi:hypothetical protein
LLIVSCDGQPVDDRLATFPQVLANQTLKKQKLVADAEKTFSNLYATILQLIADQ